VKEWFTEVLVVIAHSTKTQAAIWIGCLGFIGIHLFGSYAIGNIELEGFLAPMTETIKAKLGHKYDKVALIWLVSFAVLAFKAYRKERRRLFGL
jgi:hypothetical protein